MILVVDILLAWVIVAFFLGGCWIALVQLGRIYVDWRDERLRARYRKAHPGYILGRSRDRPGRAPRVR